MRDSALKRYLVELHRTSRRLMARAVPSQFKMLPHFMIIGAQKAGTTSIFSYLVSHTQVVSPWFKEMDFFNRRRMFGAAR